MSRCRRAGALVLASALGLGNATAARAETTTGPALDLRFQALDIGFRVVSVDGSMSDVSTGREVQVTLDADVFFAFDRAELAVPAAVVLADLARRIAAQARDTVRIEGYTDAKGAADYNVQLSRRRADAVKADLSRRMDGRTVAFDVVGRGATNFVAPNTKPDGSDDSDGRARNRRVTITYTR
jgi:OOP family OmpA-OmpF porin